MLFEQAGIFYRGLILGLMIAAPVGPIGLLCIRRTLHKGFFIGFATGMGAALADALFGAIAALGVTAIIDFIKHHDMGIRIIGGLLLLMGAWHTWRDMPQPPEDPQGLVKKFIGLTPDRPWAGAIKAFTSSFAITLTNPMTIIAVLAFIATFSHVDNHLDAATLVGGVFAGSSLWWLTLSGGITLVRGHFTENRIIVVNRITASILSAFALWAIISGIHELLAKIKGA